MKNESIKSSLKVASNILLFVALTLLVFTVWKENFYLAVATIALSVVSIAVSVFSYEKIDSKIFLKELNIYFFLVCIVISISKLISNQMLFYIGLVLFVLLIVLYFIPIFVEEKEDKKSKKSNSKK